MHMNALSVCLNALFYKIKCLLLKQCFLTDLETVPPGCKPHSGGVICFGVLLWLSLLSKDFFFILFSKVRCKMQG